MSNSTATKAPPKRRWKRLADGIYEDAHSRRAVVNIAAGRKEKRFDFDTSLTEIRRWRNETKTKLERLHPQKKAGAMGRGTFSSDVKGYLKTLAIASWKSRRSELRAWAKEFGKTKRRRINADHVRKAVKKWHDAGTTPKTILNRVRALTAMYHTLDGDDAWTPADSVALPRVQKTNPAYVSPARIVEVVATLEQQETTLKLDPKWRARVMVLAATGERPVFVKRAKRTDVNLETRLWDIGSAKDGNPIQLPLNDDMVAAWERFIAVDAWGEFDMKEYAEVVRAAGWPTHIRPYALKHSLSQDLSERQVDLETIKDWHGHTETTTTRIYTGAQRAKLRDASDRLSGRLGWTPTTPAAPPAPDNTAVDVGTMSEEDRKRRRAQLLAELEALN